MKLDQLLLIFADSLFANPIIYLYKFYFLKLLFLPQIIKFLEDLHNMVWGDAPPPAAAGGLAGDITGAPDSGLSDNLKN